MTDLAHISGFDEVANILREYFSSLPTANILGKIDGDMIYRIAYGQFQAGHHRDALDVLRVLVSCRPMDYSYWIALGLCLKKTGYVNEAEYAFSLVILLDPDVVEAHYQLAICRMLNGKPEEAYVTLEYVIELCNSNDCHPELSGRANGLANFLIHRAISG